MENNLSKNVQTISSREIAEITGKLHNDVLKSIRRQEVAWQKVTGGKFSLSEYKDPTGRKLPEYQLTKKESLYIGTKFNDEARARLVNRWEELENEKIQQKVLSPAEQNLINAKLFFEHEKKIEQLEVKQSVIENKLASLIEERNSAKSALVELPFETSEEVIPELSLRDKIRMMVNRISRASNVSQTDIWNKIYQTLHYNYHINIKGYKKSRKSESYLEVAERVGVIDKIFNITCGLLNA